MHFFNPRAGDAAGRGRRRRGLRGPRRSPSRGRPAQAMGKRVILAADGPGFLVNRCERPFGLEALRLLGERDRDGRADRPHLPARRRLSHGPVRADGPRRGGRRLRRVAQLLRAVVRRAALAPVADHRAAGRRRAHGRKSGRGYYDYTRRAPPPRRPGPAARRRRRRGPVVVVAGERPCSRTSCAPPPERAGWRACERATSTRTARAAVADPRLRIRSSDDPPAAGRRRRRSCAPTARWPRWTPRARPSGFHALPPLDDARLVELTRGRRPPTDVAAERAAERSSRRSASTASGWPTRPGSCSAGSSASSSTRPPSRSARASAAPRTSTPGMLLGLNHPHGPLHLGRHDRARPRARRARRARRRVPRGALPRRAAAAPAGAGRGASAAASGAGFFDARGAVTPRSHVRRRPRRSDQGMPLPPFQRVLDEHRDDVYRFLVAVAGRDDADDCFQETLISALRAYPRLDGAANVRAWLLTIAHRKAIDAHRARRRRAVPVAEVPDRAAAESAAPGSGPDPELWALVGALPGQAARRRRAAVRRRPRPRRDRHGPRAARRTPRGATCTRASPRCERSGRHDATSRTPCAAPRPRPIPMPPRALSRRAAAAAAATGAATLAYALDARRRSAISWSPAAAAASCGSPTRDSRRPTTCSRGSPSAISPAIVETPAGLDEARRELDEYFAGRRTTFDLPVDLALVRGPFGRRVLERPAGSPSARRRATPRSPRGRAARGPCRAAGNALGSNPIAIVVPCHRVLRSGGALGGYTGGLDQKRYLLALEGHDELIAAEATCGAMRTGAARVSCRRPGPTGPRRGRPRACRRASGPRGCRAGTTRRPGRPGSRTRPR